MVETQVQTPKSITRDMTIAQVFKVFPTKAMKLADVMTAAGLHCVGCGASGLETLEQGILGHGMSEKQLETLIGQLNDVLQGDVSGDITLTDVAVGKVKEIMKNEKKENMHLRVDIIAAGCAGYSYALNFVDNITDDDATVEVKGISLVFAKEHEEKLKGIEIDYTEGLQGTGFRFSNPNVTKSCGCGNTVGF